MTSRATQMPRRLPSRLVARAVVVGRHRLCRLAPARDERGSAGVETLIMATAALSIVLVVVAAGRYVDGSAQANDAAYAAARAASLESGMGQGTTAGRQAAAKSLAERGKSCQNLTVSFAGSDFTSGGQVVAEVTCTVTLLDTGSLGKQLGLRPNTQFTERAVVPIETYRSES
ncbi:TadE family protein [Nocardioides psychrotolerans]|uniref:TadE family protein n=1 Tax=Nocardioides psychrotolerans TaxID=1005945 RepID=UPI003137758C